MGLHTTPPTGDVQLSASPSNRPSGKGKGGNNPRKGGPTNPNSGMLVDLVSWWPFQDASGNRADVHGSNTLVDNNTVGVSNSGNIIAKAAEYVSTNTEHFTVAAGHGLQAGARDFSFAIHVYATNLGLSTIASVATGSGATSIDWALQYDGSRFKMYVPSGGFLNAIASGPAYSSSTWYHLYVEYDYAANLIGISKNNETLITAAGPTTPHDTGGAFRLNGLLGAGREYSGRNDEAAFWARKLTTDERTAHATGMAYPG